MEREAKRRRGFSRRVHYTLFAGYVIAIAGIVAGLILLAVQRLQPALLLPLRGTMLDATAPVTGAGRGVVRGAAAVGGDIAAYWNAGAQNAALKAELAAARRRLIRARAIEEENRRLRRLAAVRVRVPRVIVAAPVIGSTLAGQRRTATLSAGSLDGVATGMPVRSADGVVGLVHEVGRTAATVLLLTDGASTVPVRVVRTGQPALAAGRGDGTLDVRVVIGGGIPFRRGDLLVTSGTGGVYPPGVPVALVTSVDRDAAVARPLADPARLDFALVEPAAAPPAPPPPPALPPRRP
ncbi:MAG: rod shape-determining protein MreC [Sphingomonas fennica]